jgi:hypothetical protein
MHKYWFFYFFCFEKKKIYQNFLLMCYYLNITKYRWAILENNVPFQISNGPQLWLVKLCASLCIDKYHFLDLYGLCNMKKQIVKSRHCTCCRLDLKQANLTTVWLLGLLVSDLIYTTCTKHLLNLDVSVLSQGLGRICCQRDYGPLLDHIKGHIRE